MVACWLMEVRRALPCAHVMCARVARACRACVWGETHWVRALCVCPTCCGAAASDGSVCLRNPLASLRAGDGSLAASSADATHIKAHSSGVTDISWSPDGAYFVTGSDDMSVRTWATATVRAGARVLTTTPRAGVAHVRTRRHVRARAYGVQATEVGSAFKGHTSFVSCVHVSPRCNLIASGSFDESIRLWDVRTGACLRVIPCHSEPVTSVQFSYDGTMLASTSYDGLMYVVLRRRANAHMRTRALVHAHSCTRTRACLRTRARPDKVVHGVTVQKIMGCVVGPVHEDNTARTAGASVRVCARARARPLYPRTAPAHCTRALHPRTAPAQHTLLRAGLLPSSRPTIATCW
ncbi:hypothetical protein EON67_04055 [archaeon]|nr:MAG: hypothetical protein EON67_04055 [archaeon]